MHDKDSVENQALMPPDYYPKHDRSISPDSNHELRRNRRSSNRALYIVIFVQTVALVWVAFALNARYAREDENRITYRALYSPAQDAVEYIVKRFNLGFPGDLTPYQRPPSDELDADWEALYNFGISRIPKSQAALLANKTEAIPGDDGHYVVELDVFHQIHCLNIVRKALHPDYYPLVRMDNKHNIEHVNYCIDNIRQSLMCSSDISTIVWQWNATNQRSIVKGTIAHTCRNFDKIRDWALEHPLTVPYNDTIYSPDDIVIPTYHSDALL